MSLVGLVWWRLGCDLEERRRPPNLPSARVVKAFNTVCASRQAVILVLARRRVVGRRWGATTGA